MKSELPPIFSKKRRTIFYEPISASIVLTSILVSAASFGVNLLVNSLLAPKPKPIIKGKLTGDIRLTDSIFGATIPFIFGARPEDENEGGIEVGGNVFWASEIRKITTTIPGSGGGGGGKGGSPRTPPTIQIDYDVDLAVLIGRGRLRLLRMKWNEDIVYSIFGTPGAPIENAYEAEDGALFGTAVVVEDEECSGDEKVTGLGETGSVSFTLNLPDGSGRYYVAFDYKSTSDYYARVGALGFATIFFPSTGGALSSVYRVLDLVDGGGLTFDAATGSAPDLDRIIVLDKLDDPRDPPIDFFASGVLDEGFPDPEEQDNILLPNPYLIDYDARERHNYIPSPDMDGVLFATLSNGTEIAFYEGNETQPIDPVIAANITTLYGAGRTPAFRGNSYIRIKNMRFTKYGSIPQMRFLVENVDTHTVEEILMAVATQIAGLDSEDLNLAAVSSENFWVRGYIMPELQPPADVFEDMTVLHDCTFVETSDGQITAIDLADRTPQAVLSENDLFAFDAEEKNEPPMDDVTTDDPDETELPRELQLQFFSPKLPSDFDTDRRSFIYPETTSKKVETIQVNATMLPEEAQEQIERLHQKLWLKKSPIAFNITQRFAWLDVGKCLSIPIDGEQIIVRLEEKTGSAPGLYECSASYENVIVDAKPTVPREMRTFKKATYPANTVGTLMDIPQLEDAQNKPGVYVAVTPKDTRGIWSSCAVYRFKGGEWQRMAIFTAPCTIGIAAEALPDVPMGWEEGDWDDVSQLVVDFYGNNTFDDNAPESVPESQALDGAMLYVAGDEVVIATTWTRDNDYPNRWIGTHLQRRLKGTGVAESGSHAEGERVVFLNDALRFVPLDESEKDVERTWRFVTAGQSLEHAADVYFTWTGKTIKPTKTDAYGAIIGGGETPAIEAGTGAGTAVPDVQITGDSFAGIITVETDAPDNLQYIFRVTLPGIYKREARVQITAANDLAGEVAGEVYYVPSDGGFELYCRTALADKGVYRWSYQISQ